MATSTIKTDNGIAHELWVNENPNSDFEPGTINLNSGLSNYNFVEVIYRVSKSVNVQKSTGRCVLDTLSSTYFGIYLESVGSGGRNCTRTLVKASNTSFTAEQGYRYNSYNDNSPETVNSICIPYKIYGYV